MVLNDYRDRVGIFFDPITKRMPNVDPIILSWYSLIFAFIGGFLIYLTVDWFLILAFFFIALSSYLDALDGRLARYHNKDSKRGDFFDHTADRYADLFILLGIAFSGYCALWLGVLALVGVLMTSYMGTQAQALGAGRDYGGALGRADRLALLIAVPLAQYALISAGRMDIFGFTMFEYVMIWFAIAGNFTALSRASKTWKDLA